MSTLFKSEGEATLKISRTSIAGDQDGIQMEVCFVKGKKERLLRVGLSLEDFAKILTGEWNVEAKVLRWVERSIDEKKKN